MAKLNLNADQNICWNIPASWRDMPSQKEGQFNQCRRGRGPRSPQMKSQWMTHASKWVSGRPLMEEGWAAAFRLVCGSSWWVFIVNNGSISFVSGEERSSSDSLHYKPIVQRFCKHQCTQALSTRQHFSFLLAARLCACKFSASIRMKSRFPPCTLWRLSLTLPGR